MHDEIDFELDEVVLDKTDLLRAAVRYLHKEGIVAIDDMTKYTFTWCLLDDGFGLKLVRIK